MSISQSGLGHHISAPGSRLMYCKLCMLCMAAHHLQIQGPCPQAAVCRVVWPWRHSALHSLTGFLTGYAPPSVVLCLCLSKTHAQLWTTS